MLEKLNIEVFSMREIDDLGIKEVSDKSFIRKYFTCRTYLYDEIMYQSYFSHSL